VEFHIPAFEFLHQIDIRKGAFELDSNLLIVYNSHFIIANGYLLQQLRERRKVIDTNNKNRRKVWQSFHPSVDVYVIELFLESFKDFNRRYYFA